MQQLKATHQEAIDGLAQTLPKRISELTGIPEDKIELSLIVITEVEGQGCLHITSNMEEDVLAGIFLTFLSEMRGKGMPLPQVN